MAATSIEWATNVWNPVTGCTKVSAGCKNCYAERFAGRGMGPWKGRAFTDVRCHEDRLEQPLHWRKPRSVFVNSMSDLFHEAVPFEFIDRVLAVAALCPQHSFLVLTKRPERMAEYLNNSRDILGFKADERVQAMMDQPDWLKLPHGRTFPRGCIWPLPNLWLGVSIEHQKAADERIPLLLQCPAALRFVSCEPLLGKVETRRYLFGEHRPEMSRHDQQRGPHLDWVIVGGESGPGARPCNVEWIRSIVKQCRAADVPVFVKQLGANIEACDVIDAADYFPGSVRLSEAKRPNARVHLENPKGGDPSEWPEDLRVRETGLPAAKGE